LDKNSTFTFYLLFFFTFAIDMKNYSFDLKKTTDGSLTLYSDEMQESYHSVNGAVQESNFIFIDRALSKISQKKISVFEVGFGTGLNALLTYNFAIEHKKDITYNSIEAYPVKAELYSKLEYYNYCKNLNNDDFLSLHTCEWNKAVSIKNKTFVLNKINSDLISFVFPQEQYDVVFFDAFSPDKQPEMWAEEIFQNIYKSLKNDSILITYCAKGEVRRRMQRSGFTVERIPGPPGKREILRATKKVKKDMNCK